MKSQSLVLGLLIFTGCGGGMVGDESADTAFSQDDSAARGGTTCNDNNVCTADTKSGKSCIFTVVANGTYCGGTNICQSGVCVAPPPPPPPSDVCGNGFCASSENCSSCAADCGVCHSSLGEVQFVSPTVAFAAGALGTVLRSDTGGASWVRQNTSVTGNVMGIAFADSLNGIIAVAGQMSGSTIYSTTNGGQTWNYRYGSAQTIQSIAFPALDNAVAVGNGGTILKSTDGGVNWAAYTGSGIPSCSPLGGSLAPCTLYAVHFVDKYIGTAVGANGTIIRTTDAGGLWQAQPSGAGDFLNGVHFMSAAIGMAVGEGGTILRTVNGGANWQRQTSGTTVIQADVHITGETSGFVVGQTGMLKTDGTNWTGVSGLPASYLNAIAFTGSSTGVAVGSMGAIIRTIDGGLTWKSVAY